VISIGASKVLGLIIYTWNLSPQPECKDFISQGKKQIAHMGGLNYDSKDLKDTHVQVLGMGQK
jgi:hypothetical protein